MLTKFKFWVTIFFNSWKLNIKAFWAKNQSVFSAYSFIQSRLSMQTKIEKAVLFFLIVIVSSHIVALSYLGFSFLSFRFVFTLKILTSIIVLFRGFITFYELSEIKNDIKACEQSLSFTDNTLMLLKIILLFFLTIRLVFLCIGLIYLTYISILLEEKLAILRALKEKCAALEANTSKF